MTPEPSYGYYIVDPSKDGTTPQPGDQLWLPSSKVWEERGCPEQSLTPHLPYQRKAPEIAGYRLLGLDEKLPGDHIYFDCDEVESRDWDSRMNSGWAGRTVAAVVDSSPSYYRFFYAPIAEELPAEELPAEEAQPDTAPAEELPTGGWISIDEFDAEAHLPCWVVYDDDVVDYCWESAHGDPVSVAGSSFQDARITHFQLAIKPTPPPPEISAERQAFDAWWDALPEKPTTQDIAWNIWEAANNE